MEDSNPLKMKVTELKTELGRRGLSQIGLKFDLAQRLQAAMDVDEFGDLPSLANPSQPLQFIALPPKDGTNQENITYPVPSPLEGLTAVREVVQRGGVAPFVFEEDAPDNVTFSRKRDQSQGEGTVDGVAREDRRQGATAFRLEEVVRWKPAGNGKLRFAGVVELNNDFDVLERTYTSTRNANKGGNGNEGDAKKEGASVLSHSDRENASGFPSNKCKCIAQGKGMKGKVQVGGGTSKTEKEMERAVVQSKRPFQSSCGLLIGQGDTEDMQSAEVAVSFTRNADQRGSIGISNRLSSNISPKHSISSSISPFYGRGTSKELDEVFSNQDTADKMLGRDKTNCVISGGSSNVSDVGGVAQKGQHWQVGSRGHFFQPEGKGTVEDICRAKLIQRKKRFESSPLEAGGTVARKKVRKAESEVVCDLARKTTDIKVGELATEIATRLVDNADRRPMRCEASDVAAKMAKRAERFNTETNGPATPSINACEGVRGPPGSSFAPLGLSRPATLRQTPKLASGDQSFDPLPQRQKRLRASDIALSSEVKESRAKRSGGILVQGKACDDRKEGTKTVVGVLKAKKSFSPSVTPGEPTSHETSPDANIEKMRLRKLRFLCTVGGSTENQPAKKRHAPSRSYPATFSSPPRRGVLSSTKKTHSTLFERFGVTTGPSTAREYNGFPSPKGRKIPETKVAEQVVKMRDRQKRFAQDITVRPMQK